MTLSYHEQPKSPHTPLAAAAAAHEFLGEAWRFLPGPWGATGHLFNHQWDPFTVGVCEAGSLYVRNDQRRCSLHIADGPSDPLRTTARDIHRAIVLLTTPGKEPDQSPPTPGTLARAALQFLDDQWAARCDPWGSTGCLYDDSLTPYLVGVCAAGELYVLNTVTGNSAHLPALPSDSVEATARILARHIGDLV